jgi:hypothetical protein
MKTFLYMGRNDDNVTGMSYKMWRIERKDRNVTVWYGSAIVKSRRPLPARELSTKSWTFGNKDAAIENEKRRIREKENEGYQRIPRRKKTRSKEFNIGA